MSERDERERDELPGGPLPGPWGVLPDLILRYLPGTDPAAAFERSLDALREHTGLADAEPWLEALAGADVPGALPNDPDGTGGPAGADADPDGLEKAVPPHRAHYQQRRGSGEFVRYHHSRVQARDAGGRFRQRLLQAERDAARDQAGRLVDTQLSPRLHRHLFDYEAGRLSSGEWFERCGMDITFFYEQVYREGMRSVGNPALRLSPHDKALLSRLARDELDYLRGFQDHLDQGKGKMPYHERMEMYATAAWEAFWAGWLLGDQRKARSVRWRFGATEEHCKDCARFVARGWLPVRRFIAEILEQGYSPRSGMLACQGHYCLCTLQERLDGKESPVFTYPATGRP